MFLCLHVRNFDFDISYFCMFQCINFHNVIYAEMDDRAYRERVKRQGLLEVWRQEQEALRAERESARAEREAVRAE